MEITEIYIHYHFQPSKLAYQYLLIVKSNSRSATERTRGFGASEDNASCVEFVRTKTKGGYNKVLGRVGEGMSILMLLLDNLKSYQGVAGVRGRSHA